MFCEAGENCLTEREPSQSNQQWERFYVQCIVPKHPFRNKQGLVFEHRLVMEQWLRINDPGHPALLEIKGTLYLKPEWVVHHINGIRNDNRVENLKVMKGADHRSYHAAHGNKNAKWKGGKWLHGKYTYSLSPNHPFSKEGYVREHRLTMEQWLREHYPLHPSLVEIDGIKYLRPDWRVGYLDKHNIENKIENLKLMDGRHFYSVVSGKIKVFRSKKPDKNTTRAIYGDIPLSDKNYELYFMLIKKYMNQTQIAEELKITRQSVNERVQRLEFLNLIEPINKKSSPKSYKPTPVKPYPSKLQGRRHAPVICKETKMMLRREGKSPILVRESTSGKIKGWRKPKIIERTRNYDSLISIDGKRVPVLRFHSISYTCSIKKESTKKIPWKRVGGPRGMKQWVYKCNLPNERAEIPSLRKLDITFVRQKTKTSDEIIIYMPEKYLFEYELRSADKILTEFVWEARRWFQKEFKMGLGLPVKYREKSIARELTDPAMKAFVLENGPVSIKTKRGMTTVDESKKGYPEIEHPTVELVEADLHAAERIVSLEEQMSFIMDQQRKTNEMIQDMAKAQEQFHNDIQEFMGFRRKLEKKLEKDNINIYE